MTRNGALSILAAALALASLFVVRQRTLNDLRAANETLRRQMETNTAVAKPAVAASSSASLTALSSEEKSELLRLRGQISALRVEVGQASNRLAALREQAAKSTRGATFSQVQSAAAEQMNTFMRSEAFAAAVGFGTAMQRYLQQHGGQLPENPAWLTQADGSRLPDATSQRFEMVRTGTLSPADGPYILVAREKEGRQLPDGTWVRLYVQADGQLAITGPLRSNPADDSRFLSAMEERSRKEAARMQQQDSAK